MPKKTITIKIAGPAGFGIKSGGLLISEYLRKLGLYFTDYSEYPSLVRGGHNTYQTTFSSTPIYSVSQKIDIFFSLTPVFWQSHQDEFIPDTLIYKDLPASDHPNMTCFGITVALLDGDTKLAKDLIKKTYPKSIQSNLTAFDVGYKFAEKNKGLFKIKPQIAKSDNQQIFDGNQAFAHGFYKAGGKFYAAYPMTPATGALHQLAKNAKDWGITVVHPEDEIAAASMAVGASFTGAPSAVGTSGGGFALMTETVSLCGTTEIGVLFYLVSRPGPATGLPTWTSQADLLFSIFSGHGDFLKVVIAPTSQQTTFDLAIKALHLSQALQTPVILISDKLIAESSCSLPDFNLIKNTPYKETLVTSPSKNYQRYAPSTIGVSDRTIPGTPNGQFLANSYEHDFTGLSTEDALTVKSMADKRAKKLALAKKITPKPILHKNNGKNLLISWGSPIGAIKQALAMGLKDYDLLEVITLWPLDDVIKEISQKYKKIIVIENNQFGHLNFLLKTIGVNSDKFISKYDGRPFFPEEIIKNLSNLLLPGKSDKAIPRSPQPSASR